MSVNRLPLRCITGLLFGTALLCATDPRPIAAAFCWDAKNIVIVVGEGPSQVPQNATRIPRRNPDSPPWGDIFALPEVRNSDGVKTGDNFDINLTGNFWVRATVNSFLYNRNEYEEWILAMASIDSEDEQRYAAAIRAKLYVFLAESAKPQRVSDAGQIRSPVMKIDLSASERAVLEANLNQTMMTKVHQAILKEQSATQNNLVSQLLAGKAKLTLDIDQVDLGQPLGVRQHVLGTWTIGNDTVFSVQGWKRLDTDGIESLEAVDGIPEDKAEIIGAIDDWGEESLDDFTIENVFAGGHLVRHSAGYESSAIYLERLTGKDREFERSLYGI